MTRMGGIENAQRRIGRYPLCLIRHVETQRAIHVKVSAIISGRPAPHLRATCGFAGQLHVVRRSRPASKLILTIFNLQWVSAARDRERDSDNGGSCLHDSLPIAIARYAQPLGGEGADPFPNAWSRQQNSSVSGHGARN